MNAEFAFTLAALGVSVLSAFTAIWALTYAKRGTRAAEDSATSARRAADAGSDSAASARVSAEAAAETARIAVDAERNSQNGWLIERIDNDRFTLRNTGTLSAHEVQVAGNFDPIGFDPQHPTLTLDIGPGQSATFWAVTDMEHPGGGVVITWCNQIVQGQAALTPRRDWNDALPPKPPRGAQPRYAGM